MATTSLKLKLNNRSKGCKRRKKKILLKVNQFHPALLATRFQRPREKAAGRANRVSNNPTIVSPVIRFQKPKSKMLTFRKYQKRKKKIAKRRRKKVVVFPMSLKTANQGKFLKLIARNHQI